MMAGRPNAGEAVAQFALDHLRCELNKRADGNANGKLRVCVVKIRVRVDANAATR